MMARIWLFSRCFVQAGAIALSLTVFPSGILHSLPAAANRVAVRFVPPPPPNQGRPVGNRRGGASRGSCPEVGVPMTALAPLIEQNTATSVWGLTTSAHPTFWFYVPYALSPDVPAEFVLLDDENNYVYRANLTDVETAPGILNISLPSTVPPLEVGKSYQWAFMVYCDVADPIFTRGSIQRVAVDAALTNQLEQASPAEDAALYAANGVWYEAVDLLATLHLANPNDTGITRAWEDLLRSTGLGDVATAPILSCCSPE